MRINHSKRLVALEQGILNRDVDFGTVLVDMLSFGMSPVVTALLVEGRRVEACELVEIASRERGLGLGDMQIDAAVRHIEKNLAWHRVSHAKSFRYWERDEAFRDEEWRADAAYLARNNPAIDEETRYANLVEFWRQRRGATSEEIIRRYDAKHKQQMRAIAQRIALLRQERGQPQPDEEVMANARQEAICAELLRLEESIAEST